MKWLLGFFTGGWGWVLTAAKWALDHWKLVGAVLVLLTMFVLGVRYERSSWEKKWAARDVEDALVESERIRQVAEVDAAIDTIEAKAQAEKTSRGITYKNINEEVARYVLLHSLPAAPGACSADADIGDDGLQLIERARAARRARADQGNGSGSRRVP